MNRSEFFTVIVGAGSVLTAGAAVQSGRVVVKIVKHSVLGKTEHLASLIHVENRARRPLGPPVIFDEIDRYDR